jgi:DNA-binding CsgD family transcriptional regulator
MVGLIPQQRRQSRLAISKGATGESAASQRLRMRFGMNQNSTGLQHSAGSTNDNRSPGGMEHGNACPPERGASKSVPQQTEAGMRRLRAAHVDVLAPGSTMFTEQAWAQLARSLDLSGRELQIVRGVFDEHTEMTIATDLRISPNTVHTHFNRLHRKLGVTTRTGLALRITRQFLALAASPQNPRFLPVSAQSPTASSPARSR